MSWETSSSYKSELESSDSVNILFDFSLEPLSYYSSFLKIVYG